MNFLAGLALPKARRSMVLVCLPIFPTLSTDLRLFAFQSLNLQTLLLSRLVQLLAPHLSNSPSTLCLTVSLMPHRQRRCSRAPLTAHLVLMRTCSSPQRLQLLPIPNPRQILLPRWSTANSRRRGKLPICNTIPSPHPLARSKPISLPRAVGASCRPLSHLVGFPCSSSDCLGHYLSQPSNPPVPNANDYFRRSYSDQSGIIS